MRNLLLLCFCAILLALAGFAYFLSLYSPSTDNFEQKIYGGAFRTLESSVTIDNVLRQKHTINATELEAHGVAAEQIASIKTESVSILDISDVESVIQRSSKDPSHFHFFYLDQSDSIETEVQFRDLISLIEGELENDNQQSRDSRLADVTNRFDIPVSIFPMVNIDELDLTRRDRLLLDQHHLVLIDDGIYDGGAMLVKLASTDEYLKLGPVPLTAREMLRDGPYTLHIVITTFILLSLLTTLMCLWPLLRNMKMMNIAAEAFGQGDFSASVPVSTLSPLREVSITFNQMGSKIQRLIETQKSLSNGLAHEIRTPLSRMRFRLDAMHSHHGNRQLTTQVEHMLNDISELESLTNGMLRHASLNSDSLGLTLTATQIVPWVEQLLKKYSTAHRDIETTLVTDNCSNDKIVELDQVQMDSALGNLLKNAFVFASGRIEVSLIQSHNAFQINVDDDGKGISPAQRERVFEPFFRADSSRNKNTGGFGLGLAITQKVCQLHNGGCIVTTSAMGGARFTITLPDNAARPIDNSNALAS